MKHGGLAAILALCLAVAYAPAADARELVASGWWWVAQTNASPVDPPPPGTVDEGELMVAGSLVGATAIAAVRFVLPDQSTEPVLTLTVAPDGDTGGEGAVVRACAATSPWEAAEGGAWEDRPSFDPDRCVDGDRAADGSTWTFGVAALAEGDRLDAVITPAEGSTFQLVFRAPDGALTTSDSAPNLPPPQSTSTAPPPERAAPVTPTTIVSPSPPRTDPPTTSSGSGTAAEPSTDEASAPPADVAAAPPVPIDHSPRRSSIKWPAMVVTSLIAGGLAAVAHRWRTGGAVAPKDGGPPS